MPNHASDKTPTPAPVLPDPAIDPREPATADLIRMVQTRRAVLVAEVEGHLAAVEVIRQQLIALGGQHQVSATKAIRPS